MEREYPAGSLANSESRSLANSHDAERQLSILEAFETIDVNGDGQLSEEEVIEACNSNPNIAALIGLGPTYTLDDLFKDMGAASLSWPLSRREFVDKFSGHCPSAAPASSHLVGPPMAAAPASDLPAKAPEAGISIAPLSTIETAALTSNVQASAQSREEPHFTVGQLVDAALALRLRQQSAPCFSLGQLVDAACVVVSRQHQQGQQQRLERQPNRRVVTLTPPPSITLPTRPRLHTLPGHIHSQPAQRSGFAYDVVPGYDWQQTHRQYRHVDPLRRVYTVNSPAQPYARASFPTSPGLYHYTQMARH